VLIQEQNSEAKPKEEMISMSASELDAYLDRKLEEKLKNSQSAKKEVESPAVAQIRNELFDDIPELRDFKVKERIYVLCDGTKPVSRGIPSRHKEASPLQYVNKDTQEVYALFYSLTQTSFFKEKHKGDSKVEHIHMKDGMLKTYESDIKLQKFLRIHPGNEAMGGNLFKEYNPSKEAEVKI